MNWMIAKQKRAPVRAKTVAELIELLKKCPQNWPITDADGGRFCEILVATDGKDKVVSLY